MEAMAAAAVVLAALAVGLALAELAVLAELRDRVEGLEQALLAPQERRARGAAKRVLSVLSTHSARSAPP